MSITAAVATTRPGQGSTTFGLALAWDAAESEKVCYVDLDPAGGTVEDQLGLNLGAGADQLGVRRFSGLPQVTHGMIEEAAVRVPRRENLFIVPGLRGDSGLALHDFLPRFNEDAGGGYQLYQRLTSSFEKTRFDLVVVDLGCPFVFPGLDSPQRAAATIASLFGRFFIVIRDNPALIGHNVEVLRKAQVNRGEVVVACRPSGARDARATVARALADINIQVAAIEWLWRDDIALRAESQGRAMPAPGLARSLGLVQRQAAPIAGTVQPGETQGGAVDG